MQFLIHAQGNTLETCSKSYVVDAKTETEAREIAELSFKNEYGIIGESLYMQSFKRTRKSILAYMFLIIPIFLSFIPWFDGHKEYSIRPDLISCIYSILLYSAFIVRFKGIQRTVGTWIDIVFCILMILLISSFVQMILVVKTIKIPLLPQIVIDTKAILPVAIILSWFGLKFVSVVCIAGVGVMGIFNVVMLSNAMPAPCGIAYIVGAFLGVMLYLSVEPVTLEAISHLRKSIVRMVDYSNRDIIEVKNSIKRIDDTRGNQNEIDGGSYDEEK